jgi:N-acetyl-anhydromuramyl-L-alanine amidase AmpD
VNDPARRAAIVALTFAAATMLVATDAAALRSGPRRTRAIDTVVIHSTGGPTCDAKTGKPVWIGAGTLDEDLRNIEANPKLGVHYMIDRDGTVRSSVPEDRIANHVFHYSGQSIGIELINDGDGRDPFPEAQLAALVGLLKDITHRHHITREGIQRHSDLDHGLLACDRTQRRKVDPGAAFPFAAVVDGVFGVR